MRLFYVCYQFVGLTLRCFYLTLLTANLVDVLQRQAQRFVGGACGRQDGVESLQQGDTCGAALLTLDLPTLEPAHLKWRTQSQREEDGDEENTATR